MAIKSGFWTPVTSDGNSGRLRYEVTLSPAEITAETEAVSARLDVYFQSRGRVSDIENRLRITGDWEEDTSVSIQHPVPGGQTLVFTQAKTISTSDASKSIAFEATLTGIEATPGDLIVTGGATIPARPAPRPDPVSNMVTGRRMTSGSTPDPNSITASWTHSGDSIDGFHVDLWNDAIGTWTRVSSTLPADAREYHSLDLPRNNSFKLRVRPFGPGGVGDWVESQPRASTPDAPTEVQAQRLAGGETRITFADNAAGTRVPRVFVISANTGSGWSEVGTTSTESFTHASASVSLGTEYHVRAEITQDGHTLRSSESPESSTVPPVQQPGRPAVGINSNSAIQGRMGYIEVTAVHPDESELSGLQVAIRAVGEEWAILDRADSPKADWPSGYIVELRQITEAPGTQFEIQVRTRGAHAEWSPWTLDFLLTVKPEEHLTISRQGLGSYPSSQLSVDLEYTNHESRLWSAAVDLVQGDEVLESQDVLEAGEYTFSTPLKSGETYTVTTRPTHESATFQGDSAQVLASYPTPVDSRVIVTYDRDTGSMRLAFEALEAPNPATGPVAATHYSVTRVDKNGIGTVVADRVPVDATSLDPVPPLGRVEYVVTAFSAAGDPKTGETTELHIDESRWSFFNFGPGLREYVRVGGTDTEDQQLSRDVEAITWADDVGLPVAYFGTGRSRTVSRGFTISRDASDWRDVARLGWVDTSAIYRTPDGVRIPVLITGVDVSRPTGIGIRTASVSMVEIQLDEAETLSGKG